MVILFYLTMISHKEPKFLLPIFPPLFLMVGKCISDSARKHSKYLPGLKFYVLFGIILECGINSYFVMVHEIGAFAPIQHIQSNYPNYTSFITTQKFEGNFYSLNHRQAKEGGLGIPQQFYMTHDPPFVQKANPDIPLIMSHEHPILEAIEFMATIEDHGQIDQGDIP